MNLDEILKNRQTTYPNCFNQEPISHDELSELLSVTVYTPSHKKTNPWRYKVFQSKSKTRLGNELIRLYKKVTPEHLVSERKLNNIKEKFGKSKVVIAIVMNVSGKVPEWEEVASVSMSVQNLWLKATEMGFAGYWSSPKMINDLDQFLKLSENQKCLGLFYLGKSDNKIEPRDYNWEDYVEFLD